MTTEPAPPRPPLGPGPYRMLPPFVSTAAVAVSSVTVSTAPRAASAEPRIYFSAVPFETPSVAEKGQWDDGRGPEFRYSRSRLWTDLESHFESPNLPGLRWDPRPKTAGLGPEAAYFFPVRDAALGLRFGMFRGQYETNSYREGDFYVRETAKTQVYWVDAELRHSFTDWLFGTVGMGGFAYRVRTYVETNAPTCTYDTADVLSAFGAIGIGAGLETPWKFPLHLLVGTNFWFPCCRPGASFEWGLGQVSAGAAWRY